MNEREGLQHGSEACCDVWLGDSGHEEKAGSEMNPSCRQQRGSDGSSMCRGWRVDTLDKRMKMEVLGRKRRGRSQRRFMNVLKEDM